MVDKGNGIEDRSTPEGKTDAPHGARRESVRNLQLRDFICVAPETTLVEAVARMELEETDGIFVCGEGRVVGVVTYRDLLARVTDNRLDGDATIGDCMSKEVQIISAEESLGEVVRRMNESRQTHIAVTEGDRFIGAISDLDIVTYLAESYPKETINLPPVAAQVMDTREGG